jgi:ABC-type multidrug transport system ATPase subunit
MRIDINIRNIQHIKQIEFSLDLSRNLLICVTGKNGAGKTTLVKAIRNLVNADTFPKTSSNESFDDSSAVEYSIDGVPVVFRFDPKRGLLDSKDAIPSTLRSILSVELPIPHGERFNFFQKISGVDGDLRAKIVSQDFVRPDELIDFLSDIYPNKNFDDFVQINHRGIKYYCRLLGSGRYTREDYLSSGEYFLIGLYRRISVGCRAIVVDEVDISLDAAAQVKLIGWLRKFKERYKTTFLITTHSLAMMRTLAPDELFYMEEGADGVTRAENVSYNYVRSVLYGFKGWDKYILTEDDVLCDFLNFVIKNYCSNVFYQCKIIYIDGGSNTTNLMLRNKDEGFFAEPEDVIAVLDGDQRDLKHAKKANVYCIPMQSVEKELLSLCLLGRYLPHDVWSTQISDAARLKKYAEGVRSGSVVQGDLGDSSRLNKCFLSLVGKVGFQRQRVRVPHSEDLPVKEREFSEAGKKLYKHLIQSKKATRDEIFGHLCKQHIKEIKVLANQLQSFLTG